MRRELFKAGRQKLQLLLAIHAVRSNANPAFEIRNPGLGLLHSRRELVLLDQSFRVAVDDSFKAVLQFEELRPQALHLRSLSDGFCSLLIFLLQTPRIVQEFTDLVPDSFLKQIASDLRVGTKRISTESIPVRAAAPAVAEVPEATSGASLMSRLAIVRVSAQSTTRQALEQIAWPAAPGASAAPVLVQLLLGSLKQRRLHQRRHGYEDPICLVSIACHMIGASFGKLPAPRSQATALDPGHHAGFPEGCPSLIGWVLENVLDCLARPDAPPGLGSFVSSLETTAHLGQTTAITAY